MQCASESGATGNGRGGETGYPPLLRGDVSTLARALRVARLLARESAPHSRPVQRATSRPFA